MRILVYSGNPKSLVNFRGELLKELVGRGIEVHACSAPATEDTLADLNEIGVKFHAISCPRTSLNPWLEFQTVFNLARIVLRIRPTILFSYTVRNVFSALLAKAMVAPVFRPKSFSLITGLGFVFMSDSIRGKLIRFVVLPILRTLLKYDERIIFQNQDDKTLFMRLGLSGRLDSVVVDGSGVCLERFPFVPINMDGPPIFLMVARVIRDKGVYEFVAAAREVRQSHSEVRFQIVGQIDENPTAIGLDEVIAWQEEGVVEYLGEQSDVRPFLAAATVFVLPSYREGVPRSSLEAMAIGRPVISTETAGCKEAVQQGVNGFLVPVKDAFSLARSIEVFVRTPALAHSMGIASRRYAEQRYDVKKVNAAMLRAMNI